MTRRRLALGSGILCLLALAGALATRQIARARTFQLFGQIVAQVPVHDSLVALTFDDGPIAAVVDSLLETLQARGAHATFFVTGREVAAAPMAAARIVTAGHELGNHSYSHERMVFMRSSRVREEVDRTDSLIRTAGQHGTIYFRPPYGYKFVVLPWVLARTHRVDVLWSLEPDSYSDVAASADRIVAHVLSRVRPGSIILLHPWYASRASSRAAVGPLIDSLQVRGYRVVTVGQLMSAAPPSDR